MINLEEVANRKYTREYDYEWERGWLKNIIGTQETKLLLDKETLSEIESKFQKKQTDKNLYFAYLFTNILAGNDVREIFNIGVKKEWNKFDEYSKVIDHLLEVNGEEMIPYDKNLAKGVMFIIHHPGIIIDKNILNIFSCIFLYNELLKDEISPPELIEILVGKTCLLDGEISFDEGYIETLILADYYFSKGKLLDALELYIMLFEFNKYYEINEDEFKKIIEEMNGEYNNFVKSITPLGKRIKLCMDAVLDKYENGIDFPISDAYIKTMIANREKREKNNVIEMYEDMENIFENIIMGKYEEARKKIKDFEKYNQKEFNKKCESFIKHLKTKAKIKSGAVSKPFMKIESVNKYNSLGFRIITQIEKNLREFIIENLKLYYGKKEKSWWIQGVSDVNVRKNAAVKKEEDSKGKNIFEYLEFKDLRKIIKAQKNWNNIFKKYFIFGKVENKDKLTTWMDEIIPIRNAIMHSRNINKNQCKQIREYYFEFKNIYNSWKNQNRDKGKDGR